MTTGQIAVLVGSVFWVPAHSAFVWKTAKVDDHGAAVLVLILLLMVISGVAYYLV